MNQYPLYDGSGIDWSSYPYNMGGSAYFDESTGTDQRLKSLGLVGIGLLAGLLIFWRK